MKNKTWQEIWASKTAQIDKNTEKNKILEQLFKPTGFDSKSSGAIGVENYRNFVSDTFKWADLQTCKSLFEVGCGAGAFLYAMDLEKSSNGGGR